MATTEHTINDAIASLLRTTRHVWRDSQYVTSESTGMLKDSHGRPDILVIEPNVSPVVIETEVLPATTVESEAIARLGERLRTNGRAILSSVAVRLPLRLRKKQASELRAELQNAQDIEMALYTGSSPSSCSRWPSSGWISGTLNNLSLLVQSASIPPDVIDEAADHLIDGVSEAAGLLDDMALSHAGAMHNIGEQLRQEDDPQTRRMAATIIANAFIFHESLAGGQGDLADVRSFDQLRGSDTGLSKSAILAAWRKILKVNYWPIFDIARRILELVPTAGSHMFIEGLTATAERLLQNRLMRSHDLTGSVFQRLIVDRKFLAAFYTTPASAALLVGLALSPENLPAGGDWSDAEAIKALRIADFACGTGTLLSSTYQRISQLHEMAGGNAEALHPAMMANALVGCDVLPAAAHLTASMLAGAHPTVKYEQSSILTVAYGKQPDGAVALGSLDLLSPQGAFEILSITAKGLEGKGETQKHMWREMPHASFDMVIMNPPFTRATNHEGRHADTPNPMFGAFNSTAEEQKAMSNAIKRLTDGTSAHGNAGEASIFLALADRKLKSDGVLALVMPLTILSGASWEKSRQLLLAQYHDLVLVTIAGIDGAEMSFSADTGMGECLIVARKGMSAENRAIFVTLNETPAYPLVGATIAEQIQRLRMTGTLRRLEGNPDGGSQLMFGDGSIGQVIDAPLPEAGGWNLTRINDFSLAQVAYQMIDQQRIWLPSQPETASFEINITTADAIGEIGLYHLDISKKNRDGSIRGPFERKALRPGSVPTYPMLWAHDADRERSMVFEADSEGIPYQVATPEQQAVVHQKVERILQTASNCHVNLDFQFNSQSTAMQYTRRRTIGGRAWISLKLASADQEKALVAWANTTFGLLLRWWHSSRQQSGRGIITKTSLITLPVLDVTALSDEQLAAAVRVFDAICEQPLLPFNEIDQDKNRRALDVQFGREVLGIPESVLEEGGPLDVLRMKLSREPSIQGGKARK